MTSVGNLMVPPLCFGTSGLGNIGGAVTDAEASATIDQIIKSQSTGVGLVAYVETSPAYGLGLSEHRVGRALSHHPRKSFLLQTKVGYFLRPKVADNVGDEEEGEKAPHERDGGLPFTMEFNYTGAAFLRQFEDSLQRLGHAKVDALIVHGIDYAVAEVRAAASLAGNCADVAESALLKQLEGPSGGISALRKLKEEGRINAIGFAINEECPVHSKDDEGARTAWNLRLVQRMLAITPAGFDFIVVAGMYTLLNFSAKTSGILAAASAAKVKVLAAAPFNSGILAQEEDGNFEGTWYSYSAASALLVERARRLLAVCKKHGVSLRAAALAFPLGDQSVASVVVGPKSPAEAADCCFLMNAAKHIPAAFWQELRETKLVPVDVPLPVGIL